MVTIKQAKNLLPQAKRVADTLKVNYDEAPLSLGFISSDPVPKSAILRGEELAKKFGW